MSVDAKGMVQTIMEHEARARRHAAILELTKVAPETFSYPWVRPETFAHLPERCPSNHWNRGDDICADCGAYLNA